MRFTLAVFIFILAAFAFGLAIFDADIEDIVEIGLALTAIGLAVFAAGDRPVRNT